MFSLCLNTLALLLLQPLASSPRPLTTPSRGCPACEGSSLQSPASEEVNGTAVALGEPCGVYTLSCAAGLRCAPPEGDPKPLRTLLEGKGVCSNTSVVSSTEKVQTADPVPTEDPEEAPCRKLLTTLIRGLDVHLFNKHHDIYMPNCDMRGFFRRKQCWSSRGKQRGKCWCVDENGMPVASHSQHKGGLSC